MVMIAWKLDLQLPVQSVSITTKVVSSNPIHGKVQHYMIKLTMFKTKHICFTDWYYIDPNGESFIDAVQVYCRMKSDGETCIPAGVKTVSHF
jgi:hypothetical protein